MKTKLDPAMNFTHRSTRQARHGELYLTFLGDAVGQPVIYKYLEANRRLTEHPDLALVLCMDCLYRFLRRSVEGAFSSLSEGIYRYLEHHPVPGWLRHHLRALSGEIAESGLIEPQNPDRNRWKARLVLGMIRGLLEVHSQRKKRIVPSDA